MGIDANTNTPEDDLKTALALFVAHCGGDVGRATTAQREVFELKLMEFVAATVETLTEGAK
jgi:hypothetical protein